MNKKCSGCGQVKEIEQFSLDKNKKDGHTSNCKECAKAFSKLYYKEHHEEISAKKKVHQITHRQELSVWRKIYYQKNREKLLARDKKYYQNNRDKILARNKKFIHDNIQKFVNWTKEYRKKFPEKEKAHSAVRVAIRDGKIKSAKTLKCAHCERQACDYHHYKGYDKEHRLDVIPLCRYCHKAIERK